MTDDEPFITLEELIGDTRHIICERHALQVHGLTVQTWIYFSPLVEQKQPVIAIHGGPGFPHNYLMPLKLLADHGYPVIFYDQAGCGASTFISDPAIDAPWLLTIDYYVQELKAIIGHFQLSHYYLFGSSWGTMVAQEFAVRMSMTTEASTADGTISLLLLNVNSHRCIIP